MTALDRNNAGSYAVAIDIGGTFSDLVALDEGTGEMVLAKRPSVPRNFLEGIRAVLDTMQGTAISQFRHGTTVGTNAIIQRNGSKVGLVTTEGFRDVLFAARATRPDLYDSDWDPPPALVARRNTITVPERVDYRGEVIVPLAEDAVRDAADLLVSRGVEAIAVCFLNSFVNGAHERRAAEIIETAYPDLFVCASSAVVPEIREFERTSTAVANAYLGKPMTDYLDRLGGVMREHGYERDVLVTHSGGGLMTAGPASRLPARVCQSGPAAGVMGGLAFARRLGRDNVITLDMGGTSADISVVVDGAPMVRAEWHAQFNVPIIFPAIDLATIGAGGGTIAWVDAAGVPHSGPQSAGAEPGPACYRRGGTRPTNTDANVVLNRLRPKAFMGGVSDSITIDPAAASQAIEEHVAGPLGTTVTEAAAGMLRLANESMINAIRLMTVERGYDPRDFALVGFGGAGPLHIADLARELRIPEVIVPTYPGLVSAMGALQVDLRYDFVRPVFQRAQAMDHAAIAAARASIEREIDETRASESVDDWTVEWRVDLRYYGKASGGLTLTVADPSDIGSGAELTRFHAEHEREFGYALTSDVTDVEIVNLRAALHGHIAAAELPVRGRSDDARPTEVEGAYFFAPKAFVATRFVDRDSLAAGDVVQGPAVIEQWDSTVVVPPDTLANVTETGELILQIGAP